MAEMYALQEPAGTWYGPFLTREQALQARKRLPAWLPLELVGCRYVNADHGIEFYPISKRGRRDR